MIDHSTTAQWVPHNRVGFEQLTVDQCREVHQPVASRTSGVVTDYRADVAGSYCRSVNLSEQEIDFLETHHSAAMITVGRDGIAKVARVGVALVDSKPWSSATRDRVRTKRLRKDPRCTLFVHDPGSAWLALETTVTILDGPDAPHQNLRLFRRMQNKPIGPLSWFGGELSEEEFVRAMVDEHRLIFEFEVQRAYGLRGA